VEKWKEVWKTEGAVFKGTYHLRIDPKGRVPVPAAFRRGLKLKGADAAGPALVVTRLDECLAAYPTRQWSSVADQLQQLPVFSRQVKALSRVLASHAVDCELDSQGRILLPAHLRRAAGLESEVVIVGVLERFELWAPDRWEAFLRDAEHLLDDVTLDVPWPAPRNPGSPTPTTSPGGPSSTGEA
jgi:MraZ protein